MQNTKIVFAYKAGFRRAWAVLSVFWMLFALNFTLNQISNASTSDVLMSTFLPPIAIYIFGAAFVWVVEGFARVDR